MIRSLIPLAALLATPVAAQEPVRNATAAQIAALTALYRDLHANPELAFQEKRSAKLMAEAARKAGFTVTEGVGQTGVVAVMKNGPGPTLLIRTDMDGLPVAEATGLPFASKARATTAEGNETAVMHACGHDTHMAGWVGTLNNLARMKDRWSGTLVMIAQPAEERGLGAKAMLDDGPYTRFPKPDVALAFHDSASLPAGTIGAAWLCAGDGRFGRSGRARGWRARRLSQRHARSGGARRQDRDGAPDFGQPRERSAIPRGRHGRQLPRGHQPQCDRRRGDAPHHCAQL